MKNINNFISERYDWNPYRGSKTEIHFKNIPALFIYSFEMEGQISDGKYENRRPDWHWMWVSNSTYFVDGKEYYDGPTHRIKYNLNEWVSAVNKMLKGEDGGDYDFAIRAYDYGRLGKVIEDMKLLDKCWTKNEKSGKEYLNSEIYGIAEIFGEGERGKKTFDEIKDLVSKRSWIKVDKVSWLFTEEMYNKFVEVEYTFNDFKNDVKSMQTSINTLQ